MEENNKDNELFNPEEMQSPFESIKEVDAEGHEWWNSRKLARLLGYMKYWNFERLIDKVATFLQQEKGLDLKEHMIEIEEMAQLNNGGYRQVTSILLSRTACVAVAMNADKKKSITKVAQDYFTQKMDSKELATSFEGNVLIYRTSTGKVNVSVLFNNDTFWLSQKRMSELYNVTIQDISYHLIQINDSGELQLSTAIKKVLIPSDNCDDTGTILYNLDAIIAVGYTVQNMMHYAVSHQTAAEIVYNRANAEKPHMGLTTWKNAPDGRVVKSDVTIAKNYLSEKEIESLNLLTTAFLDMAENRARRHIIMKMTDWKTLLERYLQISDRDILPDAGSVSYEEAEAKAFGEYEKFWRIQDKTILSDFDRFIEGLDKV